MDMVLGRPRQGCGFLLAASMLVVLWAAEGLCLEPVVSVKPVVRGGASQGVHQDAGICPQARDTAKAPDEIYDRINPLPPTPQNILAGETLFNIEARPVVCKVCHGFHGDGMGIMFQQLLPKPRNFTCYYTMQDIPDGQLFWIIQNGSQGTKMPAFGYLSEDQIWQLVLYIRNLENERIP